jgi:hypothetical protein
MLFNQGLIMNLNQTLIVAVITLAAFAAQAQSVSVNPAVTNVSIGERFSVDLSAKGFPDKIFGGGYNISFDASKLKLDDIVIPASWEFAVSKGTWTPRLAP